MLERWPQVCRIKITLAFALLPTELFVSRKTSDELPSKLDSTENRVCSKNAQPYLKWIQRFAPRQSQDQICSGKRNDSSELFLGILPSGFRFTVFIPWAVEWIRKSPSAIFSQPMFLANIGTARYETET